MTPQLPGALINYGECEREPITTPGAIQSYGGLVVVRHRDAIACSANIERFLPQTAKELLHRNLNEASPELAALLRRCPPELAPGQTFFQAHLRWIAGVRRVDRESVHVEFFPGEFRAVNVDALEEEIERLCLKHHYPAKDRPQFLNDVCHVFQRHLGFDQVFVQVLQDGGFMEIVAEANNGQVEPVVGLHFSSKEIPGQARALYLKQRLRFKQESSSTPIDLVGDGPVDLTHCLLREPSKFMTVYMQNISASTLLSTSIVIDNELAALLTMHNRAPLYLDPRIFSRVESVVGRVSQELIRIDDLIRKNADSKLWELLMQDFPLDRREALDHLIALPTLARSLSHSGAAVVKHGRATRLRGDCPNADIVAAIAQRALTSSEPTSQTSNLAEDYALPTSALGGVAGVMTIAFEDLCLLFFRKNFPSELKWRTATPAGFEKESELPRFSPSGSFQFLVQEFENRCRPWSEKDIAFGKVIAQWIAEDFDS
jgi:light-regulated signal transduction histidine kinase (bacteriophytochrome)